MVVGQPYRLCRRRMQSSNGQQGLMEDVINSRPLNTPARQCYQGFVQKKSDKILQEIMKLLLKSCKLILYAFKKSIYKSVGFL